MTGGGRFLCRFCPATFTTLTAKHEHGRERHTIVDAKPEAAIVIMHRASGGYDAWRWPAMQLIGGGTYEEVLRVALDQIPAAQPIGRARSLKSLGIDTQVKEVWA